MIVLVGVVDEDARKVEWAHIPLRGPEALVDVRLQHTVADALFRYYEENYGEPEPEPEPEPTKSWWQRFMDRMLR